MYKIIMRLATINNVATTQTLRDNLQNVGVFAVMVKGDINKVNAKYHKNYSQLLARGATLDDLIGILFDTYLLVPCYITTWHGPTTSLLVAFLGSSTRKTRRSPTRPTLPPSPLMPPRPSFPI